MHIQKYSYQRSYHHQQRVIQLCRVTTTKNTKLVQFINYQSLIIVTRGDGSRLNNIYVPDFESWSWQNEQRIFPKFKFITYMHTNVRIHTYSHTHIHSYIHSHTHDTHIHAYMLCLVQQTLYMHVYTAYTYIILSR